MKILNLSEAELIAQDAWLDAIPDDPYAPCPCGCGKKFKFIRNEKPEEQEKHEQRFIQKYIDSMTKN